MRYKCDRNCQRIWGPDPKYPTVLSIENDKYVEINGLNNTVIGKVSPPMIIIAGPCRVENIEQLKAVAETIESSASYMRGGVYRYGTYPPTKPGIDKAALELFCNVSMDHGLKNIVEVTDIRDLDLIEPYTDAYQVGARQMQNYPLLVELSKSEKPVALKRHPGSTIDEFLGAAEYLVRNGKRNVMLIERGSSTYHHHVRWELSVSMIATIKQMTGIPILVDASHGSGRRDIVEQLIYAGIAAGADGFLVEVHPDPDNSMSDADQAISFQDYTRIVGNAGKIQQCICEGG